jgi:hypothetical protein
MEQLQAELLSSGQALGAGVQLLLLLTKFRFGLAGEDFELLRASLSTAVLEGAEVSFKDHCPITHSSHSIIVIGPTPD